MLSTAREIINLWVARMVMLGIEFCGEIPFTDVVIHSVIQAADGRRMSKSLGTGVNPLDLVERYGADGTRYGLLKMSSTQDVRFAEGMIEEGSKLANKLWNASRFALLQADDGRRRRRRRRRDRRRPLDPVAAGRGASADVLRLIDAYDFAARSRSCTRSSGTTSATGTWRRSSCASPRTGRAGGRVGQPAVGAGADRWRWRTR